MDNNRFVYLKVVLMWTQNCSECICSVWDPSEKVNNMFRLGGLHRLFGLVVKASDSRTEDPRFESRLRRDFSGSSHTVDLKKMDTPVVILPGAWRYTVSTGDWLGRCQATAIG